LLVLHQGLPQNVLLFFEALMATINVTQIVSKKKQFERKTFFRDKKLNKFKVKNILNKQTNTAFLGKTICNFTQLIEMLVYFKFPKNNVKF